MLYEKSSMYIVRIRLLMTYGSISWHFFSHKWYKISFCKSMMWEYVVSFEFLCVIVNKWLHFLFLQKFQTNFFLNFKLLSINCKSVDLVMHLQFLVELFNPFSFSYKLIRLLKSLKEDINLKEILNLTLLG